ncbi:hypothetical protein QQS21_005011 [Conoideocrella luteorostrata]|uniref:DUF7779 domain-containing protein n=1 Tax=Conoideocrella luteorostrata TaxID=1105319 RepID=A0AAJ0CSN2_9HYPO|nr:hypothetical protein QQS21_005011 [Conoideocrella luteorostrata]
MPSWESVLKIGNDFLQKLRDVRSQSDTDQFTWYDSLVNAIAGVIFLSTPHRYGDKATSFTRFRDILEVTTGKNPKIPTENIEQEGAILVNLADRFEGISFRTPILSVYELRESKNSSTPLLPKYQALVDHEACSTHAPMETVIGLDLNHHDTCIFTESAGGKGLPEFNKFVYEIFRDAARLVALRLKDQEYQYAPISAYSPTLSELPLTVEQLELTGRPSNIATDLPSNRATEGTSLSGFELVYPTKPNAEIRRSLHLPCFFLNTPSANPDFCGREDILERLEAELLPSKNIMTGSRTAPRQFALCGFGGIGKTEVAREFFRLHGASFDAVFWVVADKIAKLDQQYQQISLTLGLEDKSECKSQVVSREIVKGWLSNSRKHLSGADDFVQPGQANSEATWLLIFDKADDLMILADYWPQGTGSILITSRDPLAKTWFTTRPSGLDLSPLSQKDSMSLFNRLTPIVNEQEKNTARQVSDALGGFPLAISQMAGIIRRQDLTLSEFLGLYNDHKEKPNLWKTKFDTNLVTYSHNVSTVLVLEKLKPQARQLLELVSFLDSDVIEEDLLMKVSAKLFSDGSQFKESSYIEARTDLSQSSLVRRDMKKKQITVHRIVQDVVMISMDVTKKRLVFDQVVRALWANWPAAMPKSSKELELPQPRSTGGRLHVERWPLCAAIYPHILRIHQLWSAAGDVPEVTRLLFAKLLTEAAWYQKERGRTKQFDGFFETARRICDSSTHADRDAVLADIHFCLGAIAMDASDFNASRIHKECSFDLVSKICQELGVADERLYLAYAERGISRIQDRRYEEGETDLKKAIQMRKDLGNYIPRSGEVNLSWALLAQSKFEECGTFLLESLAEREKALGKNDKESARTGLYFYALGSLRAAQHQWDESFDYHERALRHMRETVGDKDFYTANVAHKVAEHFLRLGQSEKAISMVNGALEIWFVDQSAHMNEIARTTFLKSKLLEAIGKTKEAAIALKFAYDLRQKITEDDSDVASLTTEDFDKLVGFWAR